MFKSFLIWAVVTSSPNGKAVQSELMYHVILVGSSLVSSFHAGVFSSNSYRSLIEKSELLALSELPPHAAKLSNADAANKPPTTFFMSIPLSILLLHRPSYRR